MLGTLRKPIRDGLLAGPLDDLDNVRLRGSRCNDCNETTLGASAACPNCGGSDLVDVSLGSDGTLWTHTIVRHRPPGNYHGPDPFAPFALGLVELPEGIRVMSRVEADPDQLAIGMPVRFRPYVLRRDEAGAEIVAFSFNPA
jgi:uncharacterized OB-fold protein